MPVSNVSKTLISLLIGIAVIFGFLFGLFPAAEQIAASEKEAGIYFFWGDGCPHCAQEEVFLQKLEQKYPEVEVFDFEVWHNGENRQLLVEVSKKLNIEVSGVPFTVVGDKYFVGWYNDETTGAAIEETVQAILNNGLTASLADAVGELVAQTSPGESNTGGGTTPIPQKIKIPLFGEIETKNVSLPLLTVILGGLDGFNPCAMWTLILLIGLLVGMQNRTKMWILGSAFIATSAAVYFLFMTAWLNLILFIGLIVWIRALIGLVALGGGIFNLREYFIKRNECSVIGEEKKLKIFQKMKAITQTRNFWLALGGIIILAAAVNLVELICSAGLPMVFTQTLALSNLAAWQYYFYMLLYVFVFMLDDLIVFVVAMITLQVTGVTARYTRWSHLIGGILMVIIGLLLIFRPEWLMFG